MVTIKDVAQKAGVTPATVSMALNGKPSISVKTRRRIERIASQLGYVPSATAKTLRTSRSYTLGLIVGNLTNGFFLDIIYAVEEYASSRGYSIFICDAERSSDKVVSSMKALAARGVDGVIITLGFYPDGKLEEEVRRISSEGIKVLTLTSAAQFDGVPIVRQGETDEAFALVEKVCSLGHRRIGLLSSPRDSWLNRTRVNTMRRALELNGVLDEDLVDYCEMNVNAGQKCAFDLLSRHPEITAVMCVNDQVAIGAMNAARCIGLDIPGEISITGFDGIEMSRIITPHLTTVHIPRYEMGLVGCRNIIEWIENPDARIPGETLISSTFVEGQTLGICRDAKEDKK